MLIASVRLGLYMVVKEGKPEVTLMRITERKKKPSLLISGSRGNNTKKGHFSP